MYDFLTDLVPQNFVEFLNVKKFKSLNIDPEKHYRVKTDFSGTIIDIQEEEENLLKEF